MAVSANLTAPNSGRVIKPPSSISQYITGHPQYPTKGIGVVSDMFQSIAGDNSSASAKQAEQLRDWQEEQARIAREYNSAEAQKNRDWQERMSNTAHQREMNDLIAAGLNPVLTAMGGNGAAVTSGATASTSAPSGAKGDTDFSATSAMASLLGSLLSLEGTRVSAQANEAIADKYTAMSKYTAELDSATRLNTANISAAATRYVSDNNLAGTKYAADKAAAASYVAASIHAAAQRYGYDVNAMTQKELAAFNAMVNKDMQEAGFQHEFNIKREFPSNAWQAFGGYIDDGFNMVKDYIHDEGVGVFGSRILSDFLKGFGIFLPGAGMNSAVVNSAKKK